jgi:flagellar basal-body rod protein FlgB
MIGKLEHAFDDFAVALKLRSYRQQLLASNIANADTPHYKAVDIDFGQALRQALAGSALRTTHPRHLTASNSGPFGVAVLYRTDVQGNIDGNTVDMDRERAQFAENALRYEALVRLLNVEIQHLKAALRTQ